MVNPIPVCPYCDKTGCCLIKFHKNEGIVDLKFRCSKCGKEYHSNDDATDCCSEEEVAPK